MVQLVRGGEHRPLELRDFIILGEARVGVFFFMQETAVYRVSEMTSSMG